MVIPVDILICVQQTFLPRTNRHYAQHMNVSLSSLFHVGFRHYWALSEIKLARDTTLTEKEPHSGRILYCCIYFAFMIGDLVEFFFKIWLIL